ncbi:primosomal protein N' [Gilvimarinus polysaccharolyticus]|uniref:primosomal protein N' n=1 Tax=Gilvimarinus polysaccharolyticus TaxID=863921 RepID=UPI0006733788|nr:primosomal protein N' [Gilvimarinus polysaccharolyticus]
MTTVPFVLVALPVPLRTLFHYLAPVPLPAPGTRVSVTFGGRQLVGIVIAGTDQCDFDTNKIKPLDNVIDSQPLISGQLLKFIRWAANYYHAPLGEALQAALPAALRQGDAAQYKADTGTQLWELTEEGRGLPAGALGRARQQASIIKQLQQHGACRWAELKNAGCSREALRALSEKKLIRPTSNLAAPFNAQSPLNLNPEQQAALGAIAPHGFGVYLLDGTTGSGKTEVYLQAIAQALAANPQAQALVLVPEIGLTPQTLARFRHRFGPSVCAVHSGLNDTERLNSWVRAAEGDARIIIGTRSAIFTPMANPALIIIDEEHDGSFKQQDGFRYSARDLAAVRARMLNIPLILGSATPSLEVLQNAHDGRYRHLRLTQRATANQATPIEVINSQPAAEQHGITSEALTALAQHTGAGNQALVFLNRRGFAPVLQCRDCGHQLSCPHCDARLTLHRSPYHLHCHHCDYQRPPAKHCESCQGHRLEPLGAGTERSEEYLNQVFPDTPVIRIDRDSTRNKGALDALINKVHEGEPCILVGTQMLAKGHHFPKVTLVIILDVDSGLFSADFRGPERMGQLITQVAGRAGRADQPGQVLLQSQHGDHPLLQLLLNQGYGQFAQALLDERALTLMPPSAFLVLLRADAPNPAAAMQFLQQARLLAESIQTDQQVQILGPMPALMEKRGQRFRYLLQFKALNRRTLNAYAGKLITLIDAQKTARTIRWSIDIDPQEMG